MKKTSSGLLNEDFYYRMTLKKQKKFETSQKENSGNPHTKNINAFYGILQKYTNTPNPKFIRDLTSYKEKKSSGNKRSILLIARHVYGKYKTPEWMDSLWEPEEDKHLEISRAQARWKRFFNLRDSDEPVSFHQWWIDIALGKSLYKYHTKGFLSAKETHWLMKAPKTIKDPIMAIWWAKAYTKNPDLGKALVYSKSKFNNHSPLNPFWVNACSFFMTAEKQTLNTLNDLYDYCITHENDPDNEHFFKNKTLKSLKESSKNWHILQRNLKDHGEHKWTPFDIDDITYEFQINKKLSGETYTVTEKYSFKQLLSGKELVEEGNAQKHCVGSYIQLCQKGETRIVSLKHINEYQIEKRLLTLQITGKNIVQCRGKVNRSPTKSEEAIVLKWARDNGLYYTAR